MEEEVYDVQTNCFGYNANTKQCRALNDLYCRRENCKFYKHISEVNLEKIEKDIKVYTEKVRLGEIKPIK